MENTKWTNEQWEAITERDCNLLVAAAAGAGKTAVLVERIIRKITDCQNPVDIDRLLVVTFTNAAAAEMRERIAESVTALLEKEPDNAHIQKQLTLLNKASITTIHSFCLEVIRSNFQVIGIDPGFRIADETEAALLKMEALDELFEEKYEKENGNKDFLELLECYGGNKDDKALQDMVLNLYDFSRSFPWPDDWLKRKTEELLSYDGRDFGETPWGKELLDFVKLELESLKETLDKAVDTVNSTSSLEKYLPVFQDDLKSIDKLLEICKSKNKWDNLCLGFQTLEFGRLPALGKDADRESQDYVKKIRNTVKERLNKTKNKIFNAESAQIFADLKKVYPLLKSLTELVSDFASKYSTKKNNKNMVDFNDLEHFCLNILVHKIGEDEKPEPSKTAGNYRERFVEILVDEYQDSNLVQDTIIKMISRQETEKPNIFMVGDVKQSIYRFRQARPELFLEKYNRYSSEKGRPDRKLQLFKNFRSRREVVDAVNYIFLQIMSEKMGELDYNEKEALNLGAAFPENNEAGLIVGGDVELHLLEMDDRKEAIQLPNENQVEQAESDDEETNEDDISDEQLDSIQYEARLVARRIREIMEPDEQGKVFAVYDKTRQEYRKVEYRDIVILLRTTRNWADTFKEELTVQGIPAFADTGTGFFKTPEVHLILSLLQIIDNPLQDIPLLAVLRSPFVDFSADELAELRLIKRDAPLYQALQVLAEGTGTLSSKASSFLTDLQRWRDMSLYMSVDQLLWQLYTDTGYFWMVGAMPGGQQRQGNLRILFERARQYERTSYKGLFNFISFLDKIKSSKGDMGSAKILGENNDVVRIMSIHKSKGLEFPVVILAGCGKKFNLRDMNESILFHQKLGFGPDIVDLGLRLSYPSLPKLAIKEKIKAETMSEEMRILYVALTRAREKLIITGSVNNIGRAAARWLSGAETHNFKLLPYEVLNSSSYLDWFGTSLLRHRDHGKLRDCSGSAYKGILIDDSSVWNIRIWHKDEILGIQSVEDRDESKFFKWLDDLENFNDQDSNEVIRKEVTRRLNWEYPYAGLSKIPAKISVTELKKRFQAELETINEGGSYLTDFSSISIKKPLFLEKKKGLTPAEAGTALHLVMQCLDFGGTDPEDQIKDMVKKDLLTEQQAMSVDSAKIRRFLDSSLGRRIVKAEKVWREAPFVLAVPCQELPLNNSLEYCGDETVLLQGVIDCYFEEQGSLVLVDYKTDKAADGILEAIREKYLFQISCYARALEKLSGKPVKEKYIYLFSSEKVISYE